MNVKPRCQNYRMLLLHCPVVQAPWKKFLSSGLGAQLGIHLKPCAFLNVEGFYDDLLKFIQLTTAKGFTHARFSESIIASDSIEQILQQFDAFQAPQPKWGMVDQQGLVK